MAPIATQTRSDEHTTMHDTTLPQLSVTEHLIPNNDGWLLHARQVVARQNLKKNLRPIVILPGYGMNAFIFRFHPRGDSMERVFAEAGYEVWSINLRFQGPSKPLTRKPAPPSIRDLVETDLPAAVDHILMHTQTDATQITLVGCSLGGTLAYGYMGTSPDQLVGAVIAMGSPLRWTSTPVVLRAATKFPKLLRFVPTTGSQKAARLAFPILAKIPSSLTFYVNPDNVDLHAIPELVKTISDPHPHLNVDLGHWIRARDLHIRGINITDALRSAEVPLLVVWSAKDKIVPPDTARAALDAWGTQARVDEFETSNADRWYGHADLFIGNHARQDIFNPIIEWLAPTETA